MLSPLIQTFGHLWALLLLGTFLRLQETSRNKLIMVIDNEVEDLNLVISVELSSQSAVCEKLKDVLDWPGTSSQGV